MVELYLQPLFHYNVLFQQSYQRAKRLNFRSIPLLLSSIPWLDKDSLSHQIFHAILQHLDGLIEIKCLSLIALPTHHLLLSFTYFEFNHKYQIESFLILKIVSLPINNLNSISLPSFFVCCISHYGKRSSTSLFNSKLPANFFFQLVEIRNSFSFMVSTI